MVAREKITRYLLALAHPQGGSKARFFTRFGFTIGRWEELANALLSLAINNDAAEIEETEHGVKYVIVGAIDAPDGRNPLVRTVWQIDHGTEFPRLITARREQHGSTEVCFKS